MKKMTFVEDHQTDALKYFALEAEPRQTLLRRQNGDLRQLVRIGYQRFLRLRPLDLSMREGLPQCRCCLVDQGEGRCQEHDLLTAKECGRNLKLSQR